MKKMVIGVLRAFGIVAKRAIRRHSGEDIAIPARPLSVLFVRGLAPAVAAVTVR